jgi:transcriptional regulator with XRE-family HTH domain
MTLKALRKKKGLTQEEAAELTGLSRRGYQNLEQGKYKKVSQTYHYAFTRLEEYDRRRESKKALGKAMLQKTLREAMPHYDLSFVYVIGDYASSPAPNSKISLFIAEPISRLDILAFLQEVESLTGKEAEAELLKDHLDEKTLKEVLRRGVRVSLF